MASFAVFAPGVSRYHMDVTRGHLNSSRLSQEVLTLRRIVGAADVVERRTQQPVELQQ